MAQPIPFLASLLEIPNIDSLFVDEDELRDLWLR